MTAEAIVWIATGEVRIECSTLSVQIFHGRDDPMSQPVASTATIELLGPLPAPAVIGALVAIDARVDGVSYPRFRGEISDLQVGWDSVDITRPRIIAVGTLGRIARRIVGDTPWPEELDGARVTRVLTLAGYPPEPALTDPGTLLVLARDVDAQPAQTLAHDAAHDGKGVLWSDVRGRILYADALHRRGAQVAFEFAACDISVEAQWMQSLEGLVNDVRVRYGIAPEGSEQPEVSASDPASIAARGTYGESTSTTIANVTDAQRRADDIIARQAQPAWILEGLAVNLAGFADADIALLMALDVHDLISVTGLPAGSPSTSALLWVEGWRERIEGIEGGGISWTIGFATSDYCRSGAAPRWDDLYQTEPALTWDSIDPLLTWNRAVCIPPQPSRGRWDDVAASLRWDQIQSSMTWDQWT